MRRIAQELKSLEQKESVLSYNCLSELVNNYLKLFKSDELGLYGYSRFIGQPLGKAIRNFIKRNLEDNSITYLTDSIDFSNVYSELERYLEEFPYDWKERLRHVDEILDM